MHLTSLAERDLAASWISSGNWESALNDMLPDLVSLYGSAASTLGADWYDEMRDASGVSGRFSGIAAELPDVGRAQALAGWAAATANESVTALALAQGGLQSIVANVDRDSVKLSSVADPRARGWSRSGEGKCDLCALLIGRGAVYTEATADFETHDHCHCLAVPEFSG